MTTTTHTEQLFRLPDLGEGLTDAEIVEWKVAVGDTVTIDQIVVEVETAKAAVEVPVPYAGRVLRLHAEAGTPLAVGEPLITVGAAAPGGNGGRGPGPDGRSAAGPAPETAVPGPANGAGERGATAAARPDTREEGARAEAGRPDVTAAERYREEEQAGSGNVLIGYGTGHGPAPRRRRRRPVPSPAAGVEAARASAAGASAPGASAAGASAAGALLAARAGLPGDGDTTVHRPTSAAVLTGGGVPAPHRAAPRAISPLVRRLARDHGIDLTALTPSGPAGIVLRRDVERAVESSRRPAPRPEPVPAPEPRRNPAPAGPERIPLRGLRRAVADKLSRSRTEIPDATTWVDVDATGLLRAKRELGAARPGGGIGLLALLARVCVAGLARYPELNSTVDTERREIVRYDEVHLGFAAQTDRGLMVPVVRDAHRLTTVQLAAELARLTDLARSGNLLPAALTGGTFTLNNYGVFGVDGSTPIINHPEAALLGVGRIVDKPWVVDGELTVRKVTQLSLSFDHRVCDGGVAGGFLRYVADCVERPSTLLADL
ncbi:putative dihydrolipoamide acyltransferase component E2 [Streptomyces scabiei 87.22]|uniref:Dihydrolipoamide acetyltransferase component of pyruvate dehydrogenase complex n=5 Tax=Streptomyces scabiei TaxID=1930 RepID=C9Z4T5_STRSW|nr:dihydrolipoamide acetyltransferase family protein [Streptomyces scabiei]MDX2653272.1 dihydrolipoamide acetyltransferase family protein [Streptomyces scabiei]MDX2883965.1 dihydrolipoamide acetyltransferase family protein [Streptomyces scabiei]MDX2892819.1 dihydrolipoamide acetyltransferase family protein [Streptomyces scabiei]MDX2901408.1 dihydrolipoamide acetyltransferase family protein [Streptomyces scabiei]MDX2994714.1 dihydrolipoamide acetyltransferase family protein [Streptomyces scabie